MPIIYAAQNTTNLKQYVGRTCQTLEQRKKQHLNKAFSGKIVTYFYNALIKYGQEKFEWRIIDTCEGMAEDDFVAANEKEAYYIEKLGTFADEDPGGYNLVKSGPNGAFSEESKARMSASQTGELSHMYGKKLSEETKARMSASSTGKKHSEESKAKMSASLSGELHPNYGKTGELSPMYGYKHSEETKARMSASQTGELNPRYGKKVSEETKARMSASQTGKKQLKVTCPYCEKVGGGHAMKRWHFDNCKLKGN